MQTDLFELYHMLFMFLVLVSFLHVDTFGVDGHQSSLAALTGLPSF